MRSRRDVLIISCRAVPDVNLMVRCNAEKADKKASKVRTCLDMVGVGREGTNREFFFFF